MLRGLARAVLRSGDPTTRVRLLAANPFGGEHETKSGRLRSVGETAALPQKRLSHTCLLIARCAQVSKRSAVRARGRASGILHPRPATVRYTSAVLVSVIGWGIRCRTSDRKDGARGRYALARERWNAPSCDDAVSGLEVGASVGALAEAPRAPALRTTTTTAVAVASRSSRSVTAVCFGSCSGSRGLRGDDLRDGPDCAARVLSFIVHEKLEATSNCRYTRACGRGLRCTYGQRAADDASSRRAR